jgi:glutamine phosphoribosylpyrophosphate amidotransferase
MVLLTSKQDSLDFSIELAVATRWIGAYAKVGGAFALTAIATAALGHLSDRYDVHPLSITTTYAFTIISTALSALNIYRLIESMYKRELLIETALYKVEDKKRWQEYMLEPVAETVKSNGQNPWVITNAVLVG